MEVKLGYKQTEVGVIPEDWLTPQLQQITDDDSPICYGIVQVGPFTPNGIPVLAIKNLNVGYSNNIHRASTEVERPYARSRIRPEDVVVSVKGTTGRVGLVPDHLRGNISRDLARIRPRAEIAPRFIYQILQSELAQRRLVNVAVGTTRMELSIAILKQVCVPLPPTRAEQETIAEALSDADALIRSLEQLLAKKRQLKQGAVQALLTGKTRLPGFSGEWEVKRLEDVADTDPESLGSDTRPHFTFNYIALEDVDVGILSGYSEQVFRRAPSRARRTLRKDDVLVSTVRPNLMSHLLFTADGDNWVCSTGFCVVRCRRGAAHPGFVYFHMFAACVARQIEGLLTGSSYPAINRSDVRGLKIPFPEYDEQAAIAAILSDMGMEIATLEAKLAKTRELKQGMMQELLTGRIRLV